MGWYWHFFWDSEFEDGCRCVHCERKGRVGNYEFWSVLNDSDDPIDFEEEKRKFFEWCEDNEANELDYFALYMICAHDGMYGGLM